MRRFNMTKKEVVGVLSVIMAVTMLFTGEVDAGTAGSTGPTDEELQEWRQSAYERSYFLISENDIAVFSDEISHYKLTLTSNVICPNNTAYQIGSIYRSSGDGRITGAEYDNAVAQAANLPYDKSLNALGIEGLGTLDIDWVNYFSRDLIVIDENTSIFIPGQVAVNGGYNNYTDFIINGRKSDGSWDTLITTYEPKRRWNSGTAQDMTIKCSDFMKDEYVYYNIWTTQGTDAVYSSTEVAHMMVPANNLETFSKYDDVSLTPKTVDIGPTGTMYRLFNENSGEHLYTADAGEAQYLTDIDWNYEGHAWQAPTSSATPVYRLFNPATGEHHYTKDEGEKDYLDAIGWNYESIAFYSDDNKGVPMYRLFNPNATGAKQAGAHHYTKDAGERDYLIATGWNYEGISWYGM